MSSGGCRIALIAGATGGLGSAFARRLARDGFDLVLTDRSEASLDESAAALRAECGVQVDCRAADLSDPSELNALAASIRNGTAPDLVVNAAGFGTQDLFEEIPLEVHLRMIQVHVSACVALTWAALPGMIARGSGGVVNIGSLVSFVPVSRSVNYAATKSFVAAFSEQLQLNLRGTGVHVLAVCPGLTRTGFHDTPEFGGLGDTKVSESMWSTADEVVALSLRAFERRKVIYTPGALNTLVRWVGGSRIVHWLSRRTVKVREAAGS